MKKMIGNKIYTLCLFCLFAGISVLCNAVKTTENNSAFNAIEIPEVLSLTMIDFYWYKFPAYFFVMWNNITTTQANIILQKLTRNDYNEVRFFNCVNYTNEVEASITQRYHESVARNGISQTSHKNIYTDNEKGSKVMWRSNSTSSEPQSVELLLFNPDESEEVYTTHSKDYISHGICSQSSFYHIWSSIRKKEWEITINHTNISGDMEVFDFSEITDEKYLNPAGIEKVLSERQLTHLGIVLPETNQRLDLQTELLSLKFTYYFNSGWPIRWYANQSVELNPVTKQKKSDRTNRILEDL